MSRSAVVALAAAVAATVAVAAFPSAPAGAAVQPSCSNLRLTNLPTDTEIGHVIGSDDANHTVIFSASTNIQGANPEGNGELWYLESTIGAPLPLTSEPSGSSYAPSVSADGTVVAFVSTGDLDATPGNADGSAELFRAVRSGSTWLIEQLTSGSGTVGPPSISDSGNQIVFSSNKNITGSNTDLDQEIYRWNVLTHPPFSPFTQITADEPTLGHPSLSGDGSAVAYTTTQVSVSNPDGGPELVRWQVGGARSVLTSTATGTNVALDPKLDHHGEHIVFRSTADRVGANADLSSEAFLWTEGSGLTQVSNNLGEVYAASINEPGSLVVFEANRLYRWTARTGLTLLTPGAPSHSAESPVTSALGSRTIFHAYGTALQPGNTDGSSEVYLSTCATFGDVPSSHGFWDDIEWMAAYGVSTGHPDGTYRPGDSVTRGAMSAFMYRLAGEPAFAPPAPTFSDVPTSNPFFTEIEWMAAEGITTGFPDGTYRPSDAVTRQSMSAFMYRLAGSPAFSDPPTATFSDVPTGSTFFSEIEWMADEGITTGFAGGFYRPSQDVTRQAMSAFMRRLAEGPGVHV